MPSTSISKKLITCFVAALAVSALLLVLGNSGSLSWFPAVVVFSLVGITLFIALIFPFAWQLKEANAKWDSAIIYNWLYAIIRYCIAFNLASFGWKKLLGLQFVVPAAISNGPMNQQTGEWLTWYYFGYSYAFGFILAVIQIGGACLLLFRRTLLLGTVILLALMLNLVLINVFYGMNAGALLQSVVLTVGLLFLLVLDYYRLVQFFLKAGTTTGSLNLKSPVGKNLFRLSAILLSLLFCFYLKSLVR